MPNLFSFLPVEILACVPASTSGLMRTETGATLPIEAAMSFSRSSSGSDSRLKHLIPSSTARAASRRPSCRRRKTRSSRARCPRQSPAPARRPKPHRRPRLHAAISFSTAWFELRLHGIGDQRRHAGEGLAHDPHVAAQRGGRIDVERRPDLAGKRRHVDVLGEQPRRRDIRNGEPRPPPLSRRRCRILPWLARDRTQRRAVVTRDGPALKAKRGGGRAQ